MICIANDPYIISFGLMLTAEVTWGGGIHEDKRDYTVGDFGGIVGAEYYLPMGLGISARYRAGISNNKPSRTRRIDAYICFFHYHRDQRKYHPKVNNRITAINLKIMRDSFNKRDGIEVPIFMKFSSTHENCSIPDWRLRFCIVRSCPGFDQRKYI